ncbi:carbohydrate ABC transporter substrate-binding protein [Cellulomonas sp. zg-ZUI188]|uniref:Carbohydrate ABC transporter substrate-binding protein n=2 Tax=Cellulomonas fengjieae TaxID=2819978 RepID=A0ABS3SFS9_9CELL|nr:carbohydrate ABC transporter substrate-binding protein [Cellulomonas fengjieae]MBO3101441.1 carbohydrate ABC transporter substrate-binding protein [Cellulomonas fengjieae]QVI67938.1 carbohydrate ABC transporter substrate-binding protein [Cellulomonas fengjieae]
MWAAAAGVTGIALLATACSGSSDTPGDDESEGGSENITLTLGTFNEPGYTDEMFAAYEAENPGITIENKKAATSNEARDNLNTRLAAGSGSSDIEMIEIDWLPELMQYPDKFVDLTDPELADRWLPWKVEQATTPDGILLGYGTDIGPEAIAFRGDLLAAAGLPSTREEVAEAIGGADATWESYFEFGRQYSAASGGKPFFDSAGATYQGMINQVKNAYEEEDGTIIAAENPEVKAIYDAVTKASVDDGLSAHLSQWSDDWASSFQTDGFATMLAPGWMLGVIEGNSAGVTGWDIADVFPGGAGNWGGSFLTVPSQSKHPEEAKKLAAWLTAPEQQIAAYKSKGTFPSQVEALASDELLSSTNEFFNNAPAGQILANRAVGIIAPFKGKQYFAVNDAMQSSLTEVDVNGGDPAAAWDTFVSAVSALG